METVKYLLEVEGDAMKSILLAVEQFLQRALGVILEHQGKTVVCGIRKSGHIAKKIAATFTSMGQQAVFLNAAEAVHGDLGVYSPGDLTRLLSKSGSTDELLALIPRLKAFSQR
jgi:arabinose-5-phosphate isomerase